MRKTVKDLKNYKFIVLAPEHYNTLDLIRSLGEEGLKPIYIAIKSRYKIASYSRYIEELCEVDSIEEGYKKLMEFADSSKKCFLYTIDDKTQSYIDYQYYTLSKYFYCFNCRWCGRTTLFMDKKVILDVAKSCGIPVLKNTLVPRGTIPTNISYPVITKSSSPISGGWKSDVHICWSEEELREAMDKIQSSEVLIQKYVEKDNECCLDGFSINNGSDIFIATETYYNYNIPGYYSPYMTSINFDPDEFQIAYSKLQALFEFIGFEGIFSAEFIIDKDGNYYFSEINFRHSTWSYIATKNKMNLPVYWALSTLNHKVSCKHHYIKNNYTAMVEPIDYQKRTELGYSKLRWFHDLLHTNCKFYWNWKDLKPAIHMLLNNKIFR